MIHTAADPGSPTGDSRRRQNGPVTNVDVSVVIVVHDMAREAPRTITSFSRPYQRDLATTVHEVVVVDNGSARPFTHDPSSRNGTTVRIHHLEPPLSASPARAVNVGVELARGELVCIVVDGARMASPGLLHQALLASRLQPEPFIVTLAWHLGPDEQARSVTSGYDQDVEDDLLADIGWPCDGYRLFDVSTPAPSSRLGYLMPLPESSGVVLSKRCFERLGGFDERFDQPGGGLVAADFFTKAVQALDEDPIVLLGEGTFHQLHAPPGRFTRSELSAKYREVRGREFVPATYRPVLFGRPAPSTMPFLGRSAVIAARAGRSVMASGPEDGRAAGS